MGLAIISFDAVSSRDTAFLSTLDSFQALMRRGTLVKNVSSVFISNTYPAHCSVITGALPQRHGVYENTVPAQPGEYSAWRCTRDCIKTTTLYDEARRAGLKVCSIFWPVTAHADIYKNMPEVVAPPGGNQVLTSLRAGSKWFQLINVLKYGSGLRGIDQPMLDNFATKSALNAAKRADFDLLLLHLIDADSHKHRFGPDSAEAEQALRRLDKRLGMLMLAYEGWDFIVFGDHGCKNVTGFVDLNTFRQDGKSYWHYAGGCAFLRLFGEQKETARETARALIQNPDCHIKRELSADEMARSGLDSEFILGVEAEDGYCFSAKEYRGNHGYSLEDDDDYKVFYLASGKDIEPGKCASGGCITDIAPLAAHILGIPEWEMDGKLNPQVICESLTKKET